MNLSSLISQGLDEARCCLDSFIQDERTLPAIDAAARLMQTALQQGHKIIACGNGGSLCDATHFAEELTGRFRSSRRPLPAIAVNDAAYLTCTANDFSFEDVFQRGVAERSACRPGCKGQRSEDHRPDIGQRHLPLTAVRCSHTGTQRPTLRPCPGDTYQGSPPAGAVHRGTWSGTKLTFCLCDRQILFATHRLDLLADASTDGFCVSYNHTHAAVDTAWNAAGHGDHGRVQSGAPYVMRDGKCKRLRLSESQTNLFEFGRVLNQTHLDIRHI